MHLASWEAAVGKLIVWKTKDENLSEKQASFAETPVQHHDDNDNKKSNSDKSDGINDGNNDGINGGDNDGINGGNNDGINDNSINDNVLNEQSASNIFSEYPQSVFVVLSCGFVLSGKGKMRKISRKRA